VLDITSSNGYMIKELRRLVYMYKEDITNWFDNIYCKKCLAYNNGLVTKQIGKGNDVYIF